MEWVLRLAETGVDGASRSVDVIAIDRPGNPGDVAAPGMTLAQSKRLVALVQEEIVAARSRDHLAVQTVSVTTTASRSHCPTCRLAPADVQAAPRGQRRYSVLVARLHRRDRTRSPYLEGGDGSPAA